MWRTCILIIAQLWRQLLFVFRGLAKSWSLHHFFLIMFLDSLYIYTFIAIISWDPIMWSLPILSHFFISLTPLSSCLPSSHLLIFLICLHSLILHHLFNISSCSAIFSSSYNRLILCDLSLAARFQPSVFMSFHHFWVFSSLLSHHVPPPVSSFPSIIILSLFQTLSLRHPTISPIPPPSLPLLHSSTSSPPAAAASHLSVFHLPFPLPSTSLCSL